MIEDLSNIQVIITLIISMSTLLGIFAGIINKILDKKLKGLYHDNRRQYRYMIVDFAGDLHNGIKKTREEFQSILDIFGRYEILVDKLNVKNHYVDSEIAYIKYKKSELEKSESERRTSYEQ